MTGHAAVSRMLYEYVRGELDAEASARVSAHIGRCERCAEDARTLGEILDRLPEGGRPSDGLSDAWWTGFANDVMSGIPAGPAPRPGLLDRLFGTAASRGVWSPGRLALPAAVGVTGIAVAVALLSVRPGDVPHDPAPDRAEATSASADSLDPMTDFDRRLSDYFTRSKALLVGVSNIEPSSAAVDFSAERELSSALLREGRYLQTGPVDFRASVLLEDLDMIMVELANGEGGKPSPSVELIRVSIEDKNLLFKLRMRETRQYPLRVGHASYQP